MADIRSSDEERIEEIANELDQIRHERRRYAAQLRGFTVAELLTLCDERLGVHGLRGTGPRTKPRQSTLIAALVEYRHPVKELERERRRLIERRPDKGEPECSD